MNFKRTYAYPGTFANGVKAAKVLGFHVELITAIGRWQSLHPNDDGEYRFYDGPFPVKKGIGPAFLRSDGIEVFMQDDTASVVVAFEDGT